MTAYGHCWLRWTATRCCLKRIFERAGLPLSCLDAVASHFSALQVLVRQAQAEAAAVNPERRGELLELGRQLFRLDQLEGIAYQDGRQRLAASEHVDQLALGLAYRVQLRSRLRLPNQPYAMRYPDAVALTQAQVEDAFLRVTRAQTIEGLTDSLSQRAFWRRYLRQQHDQMFDALSADYTRRTLELQAQRPVLAPWPSSSNYAGYRNSRTSISSAWSQGSPSPTCVQPSAQRGD